MKRPRRTEVKDMVARAQANELTPVPIDVFDDEAIRRFSRQKLLELAQSGGNTAARQALSELLERSEPRNVPRQERLSNDEVKRITSVYDAIFEGEYCPQCKRGTPKA